MPDTCLGFLNYAVQNLTEMGVAEVKGFRVEAAEWAVKKLMITLCLCLPLSSEAIEKITAEKCIDEMNFWSGYIANYVSSYQQSGTDFGPDFPWPGSYTLPNGVTLYFYTDRLGVDTIIKETGWIHFDNVLYPQLRITRNYSFPPTIPLFAQGIQTNALTVFCFADITLHRRQHRHSFMPPSTQLPKTYLLSF